MKKNQLLAGAVLLSLAGWSGAAAADQVYTLILWSLRRRGWKRQK